MSSHLFFLSKQAFVLVPVAPQLLGQLHATVPSFSQVLGQDVLMGLEGRQLARLALVLASPDREADGVSSSLSWENPTNNTYHINYINLTTSSLGQFKQPFITYSLNYLLDSCSNTPALHFVCVLVYILLYPLLTPTERCYICRVPRTVFIPNTLDYCRNGVFKKKLLRKIQLVRTPPDF